MKNEPWNYRHLYLACFRLFYGYKIAFIFVPLNSKTLIISIVYIRGS